MLANYYKWQMQNGQFHPTFQQDYNRMRRMYYYQYVTAAGGVLFAGTVWNPNFVKRRSWYMRKIAIGVWGLIGFGLGRRFYEDHICMTMLKMYDYFPMEIKRALQDKDFRHLALFDLEKVSKERQLFDPVTGKSLS